MVEAGAKEVIEEDILRALDAGHQAIKADRPHNRLDGARGRQTKLTVAAESTRPGHPSGSQRHGTRPAARRDAHSREA